MTDRQFSETLTTKGAGYSYPLLQRLNVTNTEETMQLAPILPYYVYDGFEKDLDAACVLERIMTVDPTETESLKHLKIFLRACLSSHNNADNKPYIASSEFSATPLIQARHWAKQVFSKLFPTLNPATVAPPPAGTLAIGTDLAALVAALTSSN